jgi:DNA-binding NarL/FixJ family response regulator
VVDAEAHVLVANAAAEALAAGGALRFLRALDHGSRRLPVLTAIDHADNMALQALIRATAAGRSAGGAVRLRDDGSATVAAALVAPLPRRLSPKSAGCAGRVAGQALVLLRDLTARPAAPRAELLRDLFGLTRAEAEVARALAGGTSKSAVAAERGSRVTTVRTQVRSILEKTGATSLRDLERLLGCLQDS